MRTLLLSLFCLLTLGAQANPVDGLLERIDHGASRKIKTELVKQDHDFFEITTKGGKPCIKGNTWVNIASGLKNAVFALYFTQNPDTTLWQ
ncbi:alpha-N-acetylglucosaminidase N-terminal domain-containing protein [Hallella sp.]|uniref:alpha-N-acetylglucosaminidase N-terminal domain-containing protein n=1 Tax=Hallella sp. TaxID=2980186 RepID=UPI00307B9DD8